MLPIYIHIQKDVAKILSTIYDLERVHNSQNHRPRVPFCYCCRVAIFYDRGRHNNKMAHVACDSANLCTRSNLGHKF